MEHYLSLELREGKMYMVMSKTSCTYHLACKFYINLININNEVSLNNLYARYFDVNVINSQQFNNYYVLDKQLMIFL